MDPPTRHAIDQGATVVTATRRLSRELKHHHGKAMMESGCQAWETPDILPWDAWLRRCGDMIPEEAPLVLSDSQLQLVWQDIVERDVARYDGSDLPLWNIEATAAAAIGSLRIMGEWDLCRNDLTRSRHPDHDAYRRWLSDFERCCKRNHWIDRHHLASWLALRDSLPIIGPVVLSGFDFLTPQQNRLVTTLRDQGISVEVQQPDQGDFDDVDCHVYTDAREQWLAIAAWTRQHLIEDPKVRIGIIVPDLTACRDELAVALAESLAPGHLVNPGESRDLPFHLSLGDPLDRQPLARGLLDALTALTGNELNLEQTESLLLSPVIGDDDNERHPRAAAALVLRERLPWSHDIDGLLQELERLGCPQFLNRLHRARNRIRDTPSKAPLSILSSVISGLIEDLGWPGGGVTLDSDRFQVREAIRQQVLHLSKLEMVRADSSLARAVSLLGSSLAKTTFQPEAPDTAVEALDIREAAGLKFDCIWFADLTAERWPHLASPDPFIPVSVQREAGCPGVDVTLDSERAAIGHARVAASASSLVQSLPAREGDSALMPSPLVRISRESTESAEKPGAVNDLARRIQRSGASVVAREDETGPPHPGGEVRGGAGLIQRQSRCPRSAFLRDRLAAGDHRFNRRGLDPARRGTLVHRVLDEVWKQLKDSATLARTSEDALDDLCRRMIRAASGQERRLSGCGDAFFPDPAALVAGYPAGMVHTRTGEA